LAAFFCLSTPEQNQVLMQLFDQRWQDLIGRRSNTRQVWTAAGFLVAEHLMMEKPGFLDSGKHDCL